MSLPPIPTVEGTSCPACGRAVPPAQTLCPHCGARMPGTKAPGAGKTLGAIALGCLALILGSVGTCFGIVGISGGIPHLLSGTWEFLAVGVVLALLTAACVRGIINILRPR